MNYYKERLELIEKICRLKSKVYAESGLTESKRAYEEIAYMCGICSIDLLESIRQVWEIDI